MSLSFEMSIALDTSRGSIIQLPAFCVAAAASMFESSPEADEVIGVEGECSTSSTATSSIGKNSDLTDRVSSDGDEGEDNEVQSAFVGTLNSMNSLEEALPVRRGISKFINGKSKSFTSLTDATSFPSIKAIVKPENAYAKRRRNLLAYNYLWEKNRSLTYRSGISKKPIASSRSSSTLARAVAISSSDSNSRSPSRNQQCNASINSSSLNYDKMKPPGIHSSHTSSYIYNVLSLKGNGSYLSKLPL